MRLVICVVAVIFLWSIYTGWEAHSLMAGFSQRDVQFVKKLSRLRDKKKELSAYRRTSPLEIERLADFWIKAVEEFVRNEKISVVFGQTVSGKSGEDILLDESDGLKALRIDLSFTGIVGRSQMARVLSALSACSWEGPVFIEKIFQKKNVLTCAVILKGR